MQCIAQAAILLIKTNEKHSHCGSSFVKCKIKIQLWKALFANNCFVYTANSLRVPSVKAKLESKKTFVVGQKQQNLELAYHPVQD